VFGSWYGGTLLCGSGDENAAPSLAVDHPEIKSALSLAAARTIDPLSQVTEAVSTTTTTFGVE
jgi:hypothetical protein